MVINKVLSKLKFSPMGGRERGRQKEDEIRSKMKEAMESLDNAAEITCAFNTFCPDQTLQSNLLLKIKANS